MISKKFIRANRCEDLRNVTFYAYKKIEKWDFQISRENLDKCVYAENLNKVLENKNFVLYRIETSALSE